MTQWQNSYRCVQRRCLTMGQLLSHYAKTHSAVEERVNRGTVSRLRLNCVNGGGEGEAGPHGMSYCGPCLLLIPYYTTQFQASSFWQGKIKSQGKKKENDGWVYRQCLLAKTLSYKVDQAMAKSLLLECMCSLRLWVCVKCGKHLFSTTNDDVMLWHFHGTTSSSDTSQAVDNYRAGSQWGNAKGVLYLLAIKTTTWNLGRSYAVINTMEGS